MDILLFAILAGFLFFRLWNVLGTRTGNEKPRFDVFDPQPETVTEDNVFILPRKKVEPVLSPSQSADLDQNIRTLQEFEPSFQEERFLRGALTIFPRIILAFAKGDLEDLKKFLAKDVYKQFEKSVKDRLKKNQQRIVEIEDVQGEIVNVDIDKKNNAHVQLRFSSKQMVVTLDADGNSYDNPSRLKVPLIDFWTFSRKIGDVNPTWFLSATKTELA